MKIPTLQLVPQLERSQFWVAFAQTSLGKSCFVAAFGGLLYLHGFFLWWMIAGYLLVFSLWPQYRWQILLGATWSYLLIEPSPLKLGYLNTLFHNSGLAWQIDTPLERIPLVFAVLLFIVFYIWLVRQKSLSKYFKRPVFLLICFYLFSMIVVSYLPILTSVKAIFWALLLVFGQYLWYICYSLKECRAPSPMPLTLQMGQYYAFWAQSLLPYHKGSGYLKQVEAKTEKELAICQIKGVKLLLWALWLSLFYALVNVTMFGSGELLLGRIQLKRQLAAIELFFDGNYISNLLTLPFSGVLPSYESAFKYAMAGNPLPWHLNWIILITTFLCYMLHLAFASHIIIAIIRMAGFNVLRNTYRPLSSKSIAEFWNRFFYYFKELLVEFFFYPVFFRYFKDRPLLRTYAATMAAACFGNFLFHFMRDIWFIIDYGFFKALFNYHVYFFYTFILGNGIFFSQWYQQKFGRKKPGPVGRFLAPIRVLGFYCILMVFLDSYGENIFDNIAFLRSLLPF